MRSSAILTSLAVLLLSSAVTRAVSVDLVVNGEFEVPLDGALSFPANAAVPGWDNTDGTVELFGQAFAGSPALGSDGLGTGQHTEITVNSGANVLSQVIVVPDFANGLGVFSFDGWPRGGTGVNFSILGSVSGSVLIGSINGLSGSVWTPFSTNVSFQPGETLTISFTSIGGGSAGAHVDQVRLLAEVIPEPATATLGLLALGALMPRRRRAA